jgi:hypothetical protein
LRTFVGKLKHSRDLAATPHPAMTRDAAEHVAAVKGCRIGKSVEARDGGAEGSTARKIERRAR